MVYFVFLLIVFLCTPFRPASSMLRQTDCPGAPPTRVTVGTQGRVIVSGEQIAGLLRVRESAGTQAGVLLDMKNGDTFTVIGGPQCDGGLWWWQIVTGGGITGWSAEGITGYYFMEPIPEPPPDPLPAPPDRLVERRGDRVPRALAWSLDGQTLAVSNIEGVWLYRATLSQPRLLEGPEVGVLAWSPDGQTIAGGAADGTIQLWRAASGERRTLAGPPGAVLDLAWSPDSARLVSVSDEPLFRVWDAASGTQIAAPSLAMNASSIDWQPGGNLIAVRYHLKPEQEYETDKSYVEIWEAETLTLKIAADQIDAFQYMTGAGKVEWSPDGQWLMAEGGSFRLWNPVTNEQRSVDSLIAGNAQVYAYGWASDSRHLIWSVTGFPIGPDDPGGGSDLFYNEPQGDPIIGNAGFTMISMIAARPGTEVFAVVANRTLQLWTLSGDTLAVSRQAADFENRPFTWDESGPSVSPIQIEETGGGLKIKNANTGQRAAISDPPECGKRLGYSVSPDGARLATFCTEQAYVWDTATGTPISRLDVSVCEGDRRSIASEFHWVDRSPYLYFQGRNGGCNNVLHVWNAQTGETLYVWDAAYNNPKGDQAVAAVAWSSDRTQFAAAATDTLQVMDTTTWQPRATFPAVVAQYGFPVLAWSPDNARIALTLDNPVRAVSRIAWSPDGARLATAETYGKVHVWDTRTGQMLMTLPTSGGFVASLLWKPDGTQLASIDSNGNVLIWDVR